MRHIDRLIEEIIPPADYKHREGFNNNLLIDALNDTEKLEVEICLIIRLKAKPDTFIIETLGYMKSYKAVDVLTEIMINTQDSVEKLITASSIFNITKNNSLKDIALEASYMIDDHYSKISNQKIHFNGHVLLYG